MARGAMAPGTNLEPSSEEEGEEEDEIRMESSREATGTLSGLTNAEESRMATQAGLGTRMSAEEMEFLPVSFRPRQEGDYLVARNHILARWRANPASRLSKRQALSTITDSVRPLASAAWSFLSSFGYINFGQPCPSGADNSFPGSVLILGAGLAGIAAAKHLLTLGHHVHVLEARYRPGGRVQTVTFNVRPPLPGGLLCIASPHIALTQLCRAGRQINS
jgi:lysine-specific histone demethylase 1